MKIILRKRIVYIIHFLTLIFLVSSCHYNYYNPEEIENNVVYIEEKTLFEKQLITSEEGTIEEYSFVCSDTKYLGTEGSTFWSITTVDSSAEKEFADFTVDVHKSSGNAQAGYGVVFCQCESSEKGQSLLCVLINIKGYFCIGKLTDDVFEQITEWTSSPNLYVGYTNNRITIIKNDNKYEIYFNNILSSEFFDKDPVLKAGKRGFVAVVSPKENFPQQPINIKFRIKN